MTTEPEPPPDLILADGECWVYDTEALAHDSGVEGPIAVMFLDGVLWYLDGKTRKWTNAEVAAGGKQAGTVTPIRH